MFSVCQVYHLRLPFVLTQYLLEKKEEEEKKKEPEINSIG